MVRRRARQFWAGLAACLLTHSIATAQSPTAYPLLLDPGLPGESTPARSESRSELQLELPPVRPAARFAPLSGATKAIPASRVEYRGQSNKPDDPKSTNDDRYDPDRYRHRHQPDALLDFSRDDHRRGDFGKRTAHQ
ncbi:MAG: hypothetical protein ACRCZF_14455, partial [Gemmataceae bacterium]